MKPNLNRISPNLDFIINFVVCRSKSERDVKLLKDLMDYLRKSSFIPGSLRAEITFKCMQTLYVEFIFI